MQNDFCSFLHHQWIGAEKLDAKWSLLLLEFGILKAFFFVENQAVCADHFTHHDIGATIFANRAECVVSETGKRSQPQFLGSNGSELSDHISNDK